MLADILRSGFAFARQRPGLVFIDLFWKLVWTLLTVVAIFIAVMWLTGDLRAISWQDTGVKTTNGLIAAAVLRDLWVAKRAQGLAAMAVVSIISIVIWIIRSYMLDIPHEIEDAARTDGASDLRILWSLIIPMCLPGIITAAVIAAIFAMNEYLFTLIIATQKAYPLSVALANFSGGSDGIIYNAIALVGFLAFFPALLLVILIQNHLSRGLTMGAVKG